MHGVEKNARPDHNLRQVEDFVSRLVVLEYGHKAAAHYGDIRAALERKGRPIGVNDLHIAGHSRSEGLTLVTNNLKEIRAGGRPAAGELAFVLRVKNLSRQGSTDTVERHLVLFGRYRVAFIRR